MKKLISVFITAICIVGLLSPAMTASAASVKMPGLSYNAHVSDIGWTKYVSYSKTAGVTKGKNQLEAIKIAVTPLNDLSIKYAVHVSDIGWTEEVTNWQKAGTTGKHKKLEALYMYLTGTDADKFDIWYRVHTRGAGWSGWAKNGEIAGSTGIDGTLQAYQIKITEKDTFYPADNSSYFTEATGAKYSTHVSDIGWMSTVRDGATAGKISGSHQIEAIKVSSNISGVGVGYSVYNSKYGWSAERYNGQIAGTVGKARKVEAVSMYLTGKNSNKYNIWYRAYIKDIGWSGWAKNSQDAGTKGTGKPLQAIEIKILKKGESLGDGSYYLGKATGVHTSTHISGGAWESYRYDGLAAGEIGGNNKLDGLRMRISGVSGVSIGYNAYIYGKGWAGERYNGQKTGSVGNSHISAMSAYIFGKNAAQYELWYRVYLKEAGWLGWTKVGATGSTTEKYTVQAIEAKLVKIGKFKPNNTMPVKYPTDNANTEISYSVSSVSGKWTDSVMGGTELSSSNNKGINGLQINVIGGTDKDIYYITHTSDVGWVRGVEGGNISGTGDSRTVEAVKIKTTNSLAKTHNVYYRTYVSGKGWTGWAKNFSACGSTGLAKPITKLEIRLLKKDDNSAPKTGNSLFKPGAAVAKKVSFAIDAGHGGKDPGAEGADGRYEMNDTIKVADEVIRILKEQGQDAYLLDRNLKAEDRPKLANKNDADFLVSIHRDGSESKSAKGISLFVHDPSHKQRQLEPQKEYAPAEQGDKHTLDKTLATKLKNELVTVGGMNFRDIYYGSAVPPTYQDYYINRLANMPSCLIELGFITNSADNKAFDKNYKAYAKAIAKALIETAGLKFK